jgi:hypothetical protein
MNNQLSILIIFAVLLINMEVYAFLPFSTLRYFITYIPVMIFTLYALLQVHNIIINKRLLPKFVFIALIVFLFFTTLNIGLIRFDIERIKEVSVFYLPIIGIYFLSKKYPIDAKSFFIIIFLFIFPIYIFNSILLEGSRMAIFEMYENGRILFYFDSAHSFGTLEVLIFTFLLNQYFHTKRTTILLGSFLLLILIFYSGSRTSLAIALTLYVALFFFHIKNQNLRKIFLYLLPIVILFFLYSVDLIKIYFTQFNVFQDQLKLNGLNVASGRAWLWLYHMNLFTDNLWTGVSSAYVDFKVGSVVENKEIARAGSESFFTKLLARDGLWGIIHYLFFYYLVALSVRAKNFLSYSMAIIIIFGMAFLGRFVAIYDILTIVVYWSYFSYLRGPFKKNIDY